MRLLSFLILFLCGLFIEFLLILNLIDELLQLVILYFYLSLHINCESPAFPPCVCVGFVTARPGELKGFFFFFFFYFEREEGG